MTGRQLYNLIIPAAAQTRERDDRQREIASDGTLGAGTPAVEPIAPGAGTRRLEAQYKGSQSDILAQQMRELFGAGGIKIVPYTQEGETLRLEDGYYSLKEARVQPSAPTRTSAHEISGRLTKVGTKRSHWRTVDTAVTTETNPFGGASDAELALSERASKVRWYDRVDGSLESASVVDSRDGEHDTVDIYDATNPSITDPTLIYRIDYRHEWRSDCRVWDDRGNSTLRTFETASGNTVGGGIGVGDATVSGTTSAPQWQRVFSSDHDYIGQPILENDILRLEFDEADKTLRAYRWSQSDKHYDAVQLGSSSWRLYDADITRVGVERIEAQVEFEDQNNLGTTHNVNLSLKRGYRDGLWTKPENESSLPSALVDRLDPIAHDSTEDPSGVADVIQRSEVDR